MNNEAVRLLEDYILQIKNSSIPRLESMIIESKAEATRNELELAKMKERLEGLQNSVRILKGE